ncbi:hypothetical protein BJY01DRAFT_248896 [Aspergillus pseudoustus]|uniref:Uncharacterized protein n=1 Tax=Aspergillus pseudoustus TaxID=1810923 RepID=A0ABR4JUW9_9EURO
MRFNTKMVAMWAATMAIMVTGLPTSETDLTPLNGTSREIAFEHYNATTADEQFPIELLGIDFDSLAGLSPSDEPVDDNAKKQRNPYWSVECDPSGYSRADLGMIRGAIKHLRKQKRDTTLRPWHCTRVTCKNKSAIYWCNGDKVDTTLPLSAIGDAAFIVLKKCPWHFQKGPTSLTGILHHVTHWKTMVMYDSWHC